MTFNGSLRPLTNNDAMSGVLGTVQMSPRATCQAPESWKDRKAHAPICADLRGNRGRCGVKKPGDIRGPQLREIRNVLVLVGEKIEGRTHGEYALRRLTALLTEMRSLRTHRIYRASRPVVTRHRFVVRTATRLTGTPNNV